VLLIFQTYRKIVFNPFVIDRGVTST